MTAKRKRCLKHNVLLPDTDVIDSFHLQCIEVNEELSNKLSLDELLRHEDSED